jgi:hypothetical protein
MTSSLTTLAAAPAATHSEIPSPVTILLVVAAVGYVLWSRMQGRPVKIRRMLVLPVVLVVLGITDLTGSSAPHLTSKDIAFLVVGVALSVVLGAARGATIELYPQQGELWQRYRRITVGLWIALIAIKLILIAIASAAGASAGSGTSTLLLTLGVSLLAEAAIVGPRAVSTGVPFATGHQGSGGGRSGPPRSRPSDTASPPDEGEQVGAGQWRSPSLSEGIRSLRQRVDQSGRPQRQDWGQQAPSPGPADDDYRRHDHHHDHHHNHHGLTGPS